MKIVSTEAGTWKISLTGYTGRAVKELAGIDLLSFAAADDLNGLAQNGSLVVEIAWGFVMDQAQTMGVARRQFEEALTAQALREITEAIHAEWASFFLGQDTEAVSAFAKLWRTAGGAQKTIETQVIENVKAMVTTGRLDEVMTASVAQAAEGINTAMKVTPGDLMTTENTNGRPSDSLG